MSELKPSFGDVIENGYASEGNPTRRGFFVRAFKRTGRLNPGLTWEITDKLGKFWEVQPAVIGERLTVIPAARAEGPAPVSARRSPADQDQQLVDQMRAAHARVWTEQGWRSEQSLRDGYEVWTLDSTGQRRIILARGCTPNVAALMCIVSTGLTRLCDLADAPVSAPLDREGVAWAWLAANIGMELSWGDADDADEGEPCVWRVHRCSGGRNDREWDLIATGATPLEAVTQALALSQQDQVGLTTPAVLGEPSGDAPEPVAWRCNNCTTRFMSVQQQRSGGDRDAGPACPRCKAYGQYTYRDRAHFGDPCQYCGTPHDEVQPGPCPGTPSEPSADALRPGGEEFLEFKEALSDLRSLRHEHDCLNGGGPGWAERNAAAWAKLDELFANEDEAAWVRQQEDAHG